jgi:NhaA family Na+:H+ antiporter
MAAQNARDKEKLAGLILMGAAALALVVANSPLAQTYEHILHTKLGPVMPRFGQMSVHYWIADGLMAVFFLLVGLEVKREWYDGRLSTPAERRLPMLAAAAGMAVPALIYLSVTGFDPALRNGWAIPAATDIAFAMGVLALLGQRSNPAIKLLLVTIATSTMWERSRSSPCSTQPISTPTQWPWRLRSLRGWAGSTCWESGACGPT